eukprot:2028702-Rhodomonas_salina.2
MSVAESGQGSGSKEGRDLGLDGQRGSLLQQPPLHLLRLLVQVLDRGHRRALHLLHQLLHALLVLRERGVLRGALGARAHQEHGRARALRVQPAQRLLHAFAVTVSVTQSPPRQCTLRRNQCTIEPRAGCCNNHACRHDQAP